MPTAMNGGFISSFSMGARNEDSLSISHLLFADDSLTFVELNRITFMLEMCGIRVEN